MADIRKRNGKKPYQVRFIDKATKSGFGYKSFLKHKEAVRYKAKKEIEEVGGVQPSDIRTIEQAIDKWLEIARTEGRRNPGEPVSPATLEQYEYRSRIMKAYNWPVGIHQLEEPHVMDFRSWLLANHTLDTSQKVFSSFHSVILAMKARRIISRDAAESVRITSNSRYKEPVQIPTVQEFLSILRAADRLANSKNDQIAKTWERYRPMILLAADSGMRPQEYLALPPAGLLDNGVNVIQALDRSNQIGPPKTRAGRRFIPVGSDIIGMARQYAQKHGNDSFVFPTRKGGGCQIYRHFLRRGWHKLMDEAGLTEEIREGRTTKLVRKYPPYALRHFFASVLIEENKSPKFIQSVMGHEDIKMTFDIYGHLLRKKELENSHDPGGILHYLKPESCGDLVAD